MASKVNGKTGLKSGFFSKLNTVLLIVVAVVCILPMVNILAISLSDKVAANTGKVFLWPVKATLAAYGYVIGNRPFWTALGVTVERVLLGGVISMLLCVITAYPLSKSSSVFRGRKIYVWFLMFTILFGGGLIPTFMVVKWTGLIDKIWALVIPGAVSVWNVVLLLNFFRQLPKEMEEAAFIDGAGHWTTLWRIYLPTSLPALATIGLFTIVGHWNAWFDGMLYMNRPENYPLQTYMQSIVIKQDFRMMTSKDWRILQEISNRTLSSAQIFIGALPILAVYPFLQRYFVKGIVLGSVKG